MKLKGVKTNYQLVIGLETHAQLNTAKKLFSSSDNNFNSEPNSNVCLFDIATPGQLPVLNQEVAKFAIRFGLAVNAKINQLSSFDRKHYFYPDLPSGYQITQYFQPIVQEGEMTVDYILDGEKIEKKIRIERAHIEQDAGKLLHDRIPGASAIDYNRSGIPLLEIVTAPDFRSIDEVLAYLESLQALLRSTEVCLADLEKGTFRCDVNISLMPEGAHKFGTRCEVKNLNSFRFIKKAIEFEANRQLEILESGKTVDQETRLFNINTGETETLRSKENALDYRYFPDPDLPPLVISNELISEIKSKMPELPQDKKKRYLDKGISWKEAKFLSNSVKSSNYFDAILSSGHDVKAVCTWVLNELMNRLNSLNLDFENSPVQAERLIELLDLIKSQKINAKIAKDVLDIMMSDDKTANEIVEERSLSQVVSEDFIEDIIKTVISSNEKQVLEYKNGNERMFAFFVGQAMKLSGGKINPALLNDKLRLSLKQ